MEAAAAAAEVIVGAATSFTEIFHLRPEIRIHVGKCRGGGEREKSSMRVMGDG